MKININDLKKLQQDMKYMKYESEKIIFPIYERDEEKKEGRYFYDTKIGCYSNDSNCNDAIIMCAGDLMCEPKMSNAMRVDNKYFFEHGFEKIACVLQKADFAIANLETTVTEKVPYAHEIHKLEGRFHCNAPIEYLDGLKYAGFDAFVQANNHNADAGVDGIIDTVNNVEKKGFMHTGLFRNEHEKRFLLVNINGIKVAFLSYTEHINNDLDKRILNKLGQETLVNRYSLEKLQKDVENAKKNGAEFIIAYIHFKCKEYSHEITEHQVNIATEMANAGIDCIMGSHSHSLQPYDQIITESGKIVPAIYSLGNFMTSDNTSMITRKNIIYVLHLRKEKDKVNILKDEYIPCRIIEGIGSTSYDVWPTQPIWTDNKERKILMDAQNEIANVIGSKINICTNL